MESILRLIMSDIKDPSLGLNIPLQGSSGSDDQHQKNLEFGSGGFQDVVDRSGGYGGGFKPDNHSGVLVSPSVMPLFSFMELQPQDKGVKEEYAKETEVAADENGRDLVAPMLAEETLLQKEEPEELKVSDLAPENLDAGETEEEIKESFEKVTKSDSQSSEVVSGDETTAYQTLDEGISNQQLQLPSSMLVS